MIAVTVVDILGSTQGNQPSGLPNIQQYNPLRIMVGLVQPVVVAIRHGQLNADIVNLSHKREQDQPHDHHRHLWA